MSSDQLEIVLSVFSFQVIKSLDSTFSHLHQRLQNYCKAPAISPQHFVNSIGHVFEHLKLDLWCIYVTICIILEKSKDTLTQLLVLDKSTADSLHW